ncbi:MAG: hypothetical protein ACC650_01175 [Gammaproteobacteria bacterium]
MYKADTFKAEKLKVSMLKTGLFILLLTQSVVLQAESDTVPEQAAESAVGSGNDQQMAAQDQQTSNQQMGKMHRNFPRWPERAQEHKELIPPPPPGPYMSTALDDHSVQDRSFGAGLNKPPVHHFDPSAVSMDMYSPDRPWPDNLRPSNRWVPDKGYHFASPSVHKKPYPATAPNMPVHSNYGYRSGPAMNPPGNWPTMSNSGSRWMPSMGSGHRNPYAGNPYPENLYSGNPYPVRPNTVRPSTVRPNIVRPNGYQSGGYPPVHPGFNAPVNQAPYPPQGRP